MAEIQKSEGRVSVDWGHLLVVAAIAAATLWYLLDARSVSTDSNNLLLVQPLALVTLGLCLFILPQCFHRAPAPGAAKPEEPAAAEPGTVDAFGGIAVPENARTIGLGALLGAYVFTLQPFGFDVATFLFVAGAMAICGERRPHIIALFAGIVTFCLVYGFKALMPYPMPTTLF